MTVQVPAKKAWGDGHVAYAPRASQVERWKKEKAPPVMERSSFFFVLSID